jgi:hypothetical protein
MRRHGTVNTGLKKDQFSFERTTAMLWSLVATTELRHVLSRHNNERGTYNKPSL